MRWLFKTFEAIGESWCRLNHDQPRWPVSGTYECGVCLRRYRVLWEEPKQQQPAQPAQTETTIGGIRIA